MADVIFWTLGSYATCAEPEAAIKEHAENVHKPIKGEDATEECENTSTVG